MSDNEGYFGWMGLSDHTSPTNAMDFHIRQALAMHRTVVSVVVMAVHGGGVGAAPTVDVKPLVAMTDGVGNATPHGIISGLATTRNQGGGNAVINDPKVGDIGLIAISDRDISALKSNKGQPSNPGSRRVGNLADGVYIGAMINPANPDQAVQFTETGIRIFDKNGVLIETSAGAIVTVTGDLRVSGSITAGYGTGDAVSLQTHTHPTTPPGPEAQPNPGT